MARRGSRAAHAATKDNLQRNQPGGSIGGPLIRNRLFFFSAYQSTILEQTPTDTLSIVPTPAILAGDWRAFNAAFNPRWTDPDFADGFVEVRFKALRGREDQAGGVVWRWKDGDNYYVARANALENNVSLYYTTKGRRNTIRYVDAPVPRDAWHTLRVEFAGEHIRVALNGKTYIDVRDGRITGAGAVGVWTKADSVTSFDDFTYGASLGRP